MSKKESKQEPATPARPRTWSERLQLNIASFLCMFVASLATSAGLALAYLVVAGLSADDPNASLGLMLLSIAFAPGPVLLLVALGHELLTRSLRLVGLRGWFEEIFARYAPDSVFAASMSSREWLHRGLAAWLTIAVMLPCFLLGIVLSAVIFMRATGTGPDDRSYSVFLMLLVLMTGIVVCGALGYVLLSVMLRLLRLDDWFRRNSQSGAPRGRVGRWLQRVDERFHALLRRMIPRQE